MGRITRRSILGSDCIDSYFDALSALWLRSYCSPSALWLISECSLTADLFLTDCLKIWARMMKIDCSRQTWTKRTSAFLELLSEQKNVRTLLLGKQHWTWILHINRNKYYHSLTHLRAQMRVFLRTINQRHFFLDSGLSILSCLLVMQQILWCCITRAPVSRRSQEPVNDGLQRRWQPFELWSRDWKHWAMFSPMGSLMRFGELLGILLNSSINLQPCLNHSKIFT